MRNNYKTENYVFFLFPKSNCFQIARVSASRFWIWSDWKVYSDGFKFTSETCLKIFTSERTIFQNVLPWVEISFSPYLYCLPTACPNFFWWQRALEFTIRVLIESHKKLSELYVVKLRQKIKMEQYHEPQKGRKHEYVSRHLAPF